MQSRSNKGDLTIPVIEGYVSVRKHVQGGVITGLKKYAKDFKMGDWKKRWIKLEEKQVLISKEKGLSTVQCIYLNNANVYLMEGEPNLFKLSCKSWVKKGRLQNDSRIFYFKANSQAEVTNWMYWIQYAIEFDDFKKEIDSEKSKKKSDEVGAKGEDGTNNDDSILQVSVIEGDGFSVLENPNAYVVVAVGAQQFRTPVVFNSLNPVWNEQVTFSVLNQVLPSGVITFKVWDRDSFGTDDFLGQFSVPLNYLFDSKFEVSRKDSITDEADLGFSYKYLETTSWYRLNPRTPGDEASGKLKIKLCLCLNAKYDINSMASKSLNPSTYDYSDVTIGETVESPHPRSGSKDVHPRSVSIDKEDNEPLKNNFDGNVVESIEDSLKKILRKVESGTAITASEINNTLSQIKSIRRDSADVSSVIPSEPAPKQHNEIKDRSREDNEAREIRRFSDVFGYNLDPAQKDWLSKEYTRLVRRELMLDNYSAVAWKGILFDDKSEEDATFDDKQYKYTDQEGNTQGPFSASLMRIWYNHGYFQPHVLLKVFDNYF